MVPGIGILILSPFKNEEAKILNNEKLSNQSSKKIDHTSKQIVLIYGSYSLFSQLVRTFSFCFFASICVHIFRKEVKWKRKQLIFVFTVVGQFLLSILDKIQNDYLLFNFSNEVKWKRKQLYFTVIGQFLLSILNKIQNNYLLLNKNDLFIFR